MKSDLKERKAIDTLAADLSDDDLTAISRLRKKIGDEERRTAWIKGLYYISLVDTEFTEGEKAIVEGIACALGYNADALEELIQEIDETVDSIDKFAFVGDKKFKEMLFKEMGTLTYIKGYQLSAEDEALKTVAEKMEISTSKAEQILVDVYMITQTGVEPGRFSSPAAKVALGAGGVIAGAALVAITAGAAAPAIGAIIGGGMGLSGAAASSAGLAILGGGTLAAGGGGVAAGAAAVVAAGAVVGGGGAAVAFSVKENISSAHDMKKLKGVIKKQLKDNITKQEITENLINAIET